MVKQKLTTNLALLLKNFSAIFCVLFVALSTGIASDLEDWNIAIGIHGTEWEVSTNKVKISSQIVGLNVVENLRPGYGYWVRKRGQKKFRTLNQLDGGPLNIEISSAGYAFINPRIKTATSPQNLFESVSGIESIWQYQPDQAEWLYYSPQGLTSSTLNSMELVLPGEPIWLKTSKNFVLIKSAGAIDTVVVKGGASTSADLSAATSTVFKFKPEISRKFKRKLGKHKHHYSSRLDELPDGLDFELIGDFSSADALKTVRVIQRNSDGSVKVIGSPRVAGRALRLPLKLVLTEIGEYQLEVQLKTEAGWITHNKVEWNIEEPPTGLLGLFEQLRKKGFQRKILNNIRASISATTSQTDSARKTYLTTDQVQKIQVTVTGPDMNPITQIFNGFTSSGVLKIPPGPDRKIVVDFIDVHGDAIVSGSATMDVVRPTESNSAPPKITLEPAPLPLPLPEVFVNVPDPGLHVAPIAIQIQSSGSEIFYTLDGTDPKFVNNTNVVSALDSVNLSFDKDVTFRYFVKGANGVRTGVETLNYNVVPPPQAQLQILDQSINGVYLEQVRTRFLSPQSDTIVYYTTDGTQPSADGPLGVTPINLVFSQDTTVRYFAESVEGFQSDEQSVQLKIIQLEDIPGISLNVPSSGLYMSPLTISINSTDTEIRYTLDGSNPKTDANQGLIVANDELTLNLEQNTVFRYYLHRTQEGISSKVRTTQYEVVPPPDISLNAIDPTLDSKFLERAKVRFESIYDGTSVFYTLDGSKPNQGSTSSTVPLTLIFNQDTTVNYFAISKDGFSTQTQSVEFIVIPDPIVSVTQPTTAVVPLNGLNLRGIQFPGQELKLLVNGKVRADSVAANQDETGFQINIDSLSQGSNLIRIEKYSDEGELLKGIEFELVRPVVNELFGFVGFDMPSAFFSLNRVGGAVAADYDETDEELVFYNSDRGVIFKRDSQNVMRLLTYLPDVPDAKLNPSDSELRFIFPYPVSSDSGVQYVAGRKGKDRTFIADSYEPALGAGLVVIRSFDGTKVKDVAGHNAKPVSDAKAVRLVKNIGNFPNTKVYEPDLSIVGTNLSTSADTLVISPEIYALVKVQSKLYFNQGDALYRLDPSNNTVNWVLGSHYGGEEPESIANIPVTTIYGTMTSLERYDDDSLAVSFAREDQYNRPVYLYRIFVEGQSAGNFELLHVIGGGQSSIAGKDNFDPSKAALEFEGLVVHKGVTHFLASPLYDAQAQNFETSSNLYRIESSGSAKLILDSSKGFTYAPAKLNQLRESPQILFNAGPDILLMNLYIEDYAEEYSTSTEVYVSESTEKESIEYASLDSDQTISQEAQDSEASSFVSSHIEYELEYSLLKPNGKVQYLIGTEGYFETPMMEEVMIWPNGDMTLLFAPEDDDHSDFNPEEAEEQGYTLFHKQSGKAIPVSEIESSVYSTNYNERLFGLIPKFNANSFQILTIQGEQHLQRLVAIDPVSHKGTNFGTDSEGFEKLLDDMEKVTKGITSTVEYLIDNPRAGSVDMNTFKFAAQNNLGLNKVSLPQVSYFKYDIDWSTKNLIIMLRAKSNLEFYSVDLSSSDLAISFLYDSSSIGLNFDGTTYTLDHHDLELFVEAEVAVLSNKGSVIKFPIETPAQTELIFVSSGDSENSVNFTDKVNQFELQDIAVTSDESVFALFRDLTTGVPEGRHILAEMLPNEVRSIMKFKAEDKALPKLGLDSRSQIQGKFPSELRLSLGHPELIAAGNQLYLVGYGEEQSSILAFDDRKQNSFTITIDNLALSSGSTQSVSANDVLTFSYDPASKAKELYFQIGGVPVSYDSGDAEILINPHVHDFSTNTLMAGGIAKDHYGRNSQSFTGFNSSLNYSQDLLSFVPKPSEITIATDIDTLRFFGNQTELTVMASAYTTSFKVEYLNAEGSAIETETYTAYGDDEYLEMFLYVPDFVDQVAITGYNPKGSSSPKYVSVERKKSRALTGLHGSEVHLAANRLPVKFYRTLSDGVTIIPDRLNYNYGEQAYTFYKVGMDQIVEGNWIYDDDDDFLVDSDVIEDIYQEGYFTFFLRKDQVYSSTNKTLYFGVQDSDLPDLVSATSLMSLTNTPYKLTALNDTLLVVASIDSNNVNRIHVVEVADLIDAGQDLNAISTVLNQGFELIELPLLYAGSNLVDKQIDFLKTSGTAVHLGLSDKSSSGNKWVYEIKEEQSGFVSNLLLVHESSANTPMLNDEESEFALDQRNFNKIGSFHKTDGKYFMTLLPNTIEDGGSIYEWSAEPFQEDGFNEVGEGSGASGYAKLYLKTHYQESDLVETFRKPIQGGASATTQIELTELGLMRLDTQGNLSLLVENFLYPVMVENEVLNQAYPNELKPFQAASFREKLSLVKEDSSEAGFYLLGKEGRLFYLHKSVGLIYPSSSSDYVAFSNHPHSNDGNGLNVVGTSDGNIYTVDFDNKALEMELLLTLPQNGGPLSALQLERDSLFIARGARVFKYNLSNQVLTFLFDLNQQGYLGQKVVSIASVGASGEGIFCFLKNISSPGETGTILYSEDGENFSTWNSSIYSLSNNLDTVFMVGSHNVAKVSKLDLSSNYVPLNYGSGYWDMFQTVADHIPSTLVSYFIGSDFSQNQYLIQDIDFVGSQLRVISNHEIYSDIVYGAQASKTGVLSNGDSVTFEVQLKDINGNTFDHPPGFDVIARFNGQLLQWDSVSADTRKATYVVKARDPNNLATELDSLMVVTSDGAVTNYLGFAISDVSGIQPDKSTISDWSVETLIYQTGNQQQDPQLSVELLQRGDDAAQQGVLFVESPLGKDSFEFNHGSVVSDQIVTQTITLSTNSSLYLSNGAEPEGDWYFSWIPYVDSITRLDDADRNNNAKKVHFNETPRLGGIPARIVFHELNHKKYLEINIIDENTCDTELTLYSVPDSNIVSTTLSIYECHAQLQIESVNYGVTTFALKIEDEEGKSRIQEYRAEVQIDKIFSPVDSLSLLVGQSFNIPFSVVLDSQASYEFIGVHTNSGIVSSFSSAPGTGTPVYHAEMKLQLGQAVGSDHVQIQLHKNGSIVDSFDIQVQASYSPDLAVPPMDYFSDYAELALENEGYANVYHSHGQDGQDVHYIGILNSQGQIDGYSTKFDIVNGYVSGLTQYKDDYYVLVNGYDELAKEYILKIVRVDADGSLGWVRQFDLNNYSVQDAVITTNNNGELLVSFKAYNYTNSTTLLAWQTLSGNESAGDTSFSTYPSTILTGTDVDEFEMIQYDDELLIAWIKRDANFYQGGHLHASRWNSSDGSLISSSELINPDLVYSVDLAHNTTSIYFLTREVSLNSTGAVSNNRLSLLHYSNDEIQSDYELDLGSALDVYDSDKPKAMIDIQEDGTVIIATQLHHRRLLNQATKFDQTAIYTMVFDSSLNPLSEPLRVSAQVPERAASLNDLEYLGDGLWAFAWVSQSQASRNGSYKSHGQVFIRIFDTEDNGFYASESYSEANISIDALELQKLASDLLIIIGDNSGVYYHLRPIPVSSAN